MSFYNSEDLMEDMLISAPKLEFEDDSAKLISRFGIKVADRFDDEIHEQIIKIAKEEGLTNVFVLNKNRIAEVLKIGLEAEQEINRKNAEIERLTKSNTEMFVTISKQDAEIERLKYCNEVNIESVGTLHQRLKTARAEAIKEFAERVKAHLNDVARWSFHGDENEYFIIGKPFLDQIAKEMGVEL